MTARQGGAPRRDDVDGRAVRAVGEASTPRPTVLRRALAASSPRQWPLWALPRPVLLLVLSVDLVALLVGLGLAVSRPVGEHDLLVACVLALGAVVHLEAARHIERIRHVDSVDSGVPYIDAKSMWSFAGLVLLAPGPALGLVVFTLVWWRLRVSNRPPPHRWVYSGATIVLGSAAAAAVLVPIGPGAVAELGERPEVVALLALAALVRWVVNHGLVVAVLCLAAPGTPWRRRIGSTTDNLVGLGALALGLALAVLVEISPWLVPVLLVPVLAMHRGLLLGHFARTARTDPKTGLATLAHWREHATRELARVRRRGGGLGVLMLDLDEFKTVNDSHGHVTGDLVLRAVADVVRSEVRAEDAVGRFGGEEFVVLLVEVDPEQLLSAAERIRHRVAGCDGVPGASGAEVGRLTVSIGAASWPSVAEDLDALVAAADSALLRAKRDGRNRVRSADPAAPAV